MHHGAVNIITLEGAANTCDNTLSPAISMPRQKVRNHISVIEQGEVSDEEFAMVKRIVERRGRDTARATVAPIDTAQYRSPRSPTPETSFDTCVCVNMEKKDEGTMDPERATIGQYVS